MNCDHAFDLMTDPALDDCAELHAHLDGCPRCRQMYETLSPALGLFTAAAPAGTVQPVANHAASDRSVDIAEQIAVRLAREPLPRVPSSRSPRPLQAWACVLAGGLVLFSAIGLTALRSAAPVAPTSADRCTWLHRDAVGPDQRAEAVVLSCVACHAERQRRLQEPTTALPSPWTEWSVPTLAEIEPVLSFDHPAWLQQAIWPMEPTAHT